jgi:hypothetical protein
MNQEKEAAGPSNVNNATGTMLLLGRVRFVCGVCGVFVLDGGMFEDVPALCPRCIWNGRGRYDHCSSPNFQRGSSRFN